MKKNLNIKRIVFKKSCSAWITYLLITSNKVSPACAGLHKSQIVVTMPVSSYKECLHKHILQNILKEKYEDIPHVDKHIYKKKMCGALVKKIWKFDYLSNLHSVDDFMSLLKSIFIMFNCTCQFSMRTEI